LKDFNAQLSRDILGIASYLCKGIYQTLTSIFQMIFDFILFSEAGGLSEKISSSIRLEDSLDGQGRFRSWRSRPIIISEVYSSQSTSCYMEHIIPESNDDIKKAGGSWSKSRKVQWIL
jgi:hypothetical protein